MQRDKYLSVTALTQYIKRKFDVDPYLGRVYLVGEISNFRIRSNSHQYFSIKDEKSKISAIMFKSSFSKIKFTPEEGMKVFVTGRISLYEPGGTYQIYIDNMEPDGIGALYKAYEQLKNKLKKEGIFDLPKRKILTFPKRIAVVTSQSGAVIRDIITTVSRRYPIAQVVLYPALVQGEKAADDIVKQIKRVNNDANFDTLIIGRGGGSFEDLWPFNEEIVAEAIVNSNIPVISSVGHETDTTISDLVADVRAATPTAAAELATPELSQILIRISDFKNRLLTTQKKQINSKNNELQKLNNRNIMQHPNMIYDIYTQKLDQLTINLNNLIIQYINNYDNSIQKLHQKLLNNSPEGQIKNYYSILSLNNEKLNYNYSNIFVNKNNRFSNLINKLDSLSPLKTLQRGYSVVLKENSILSKSEDFKVGDLINIQISDGLINATINEVNKDDK